jgi:hypothetical protein
VLLGTAALGAAACNRHHLADYDFMDRTIAVVSYGTPVPRLWTGPIDVEGDNPLDLILSAGGRVAREVEARSARARMDSATQRIEVEGRLADRVLERAAVYLGARPGPRDEADFLLEIDLEALGLDATRDYPHLLVQGKALLLDARTGREIWSENVHGNDPLSPGFFREDVVGDVATAAVLRSLTVEDFERILDQLVDYVADRVTDELRKDLRDVR